MNCAKSSLATLKETKVEKVAIKLLNSILLKLEVELHSLHRKIEKMEMKIATLPSEYFLTHQYKAEVTVLNDLKRKRKDVKEQLLLVKTTKLS
ncbi:hypothetical protein H1D32_21100 [Anaerobacillus sp. CMMVII]|uniref:hypothetical protein n=1 Tax=Anaerobacillus sp. CMMVII TaxID=2755588 RepID=UPI0021B7949C|nr:hypothetical protein [Anaerobacillus sp. CMMVII]MCT8139976.1 hypothetical protein [Anaerobacillus sp. CMMVII]